MEASEAARAARPAVSRPIANFEAALVREAPPFGLVCAFTLLTWSLWPNWPGLAALAGSLTCFGALGYVLASFSAPPP